MKIAILQFAPKLGDVRGNMERADGILEGSEDVQSDVDLLLLPEMAFSG